MTIFREEATSALGGFHAGPLSWSNWNLEMLVFVEGEKPEYLITTFHPFDDWYAVIELTDLNTRLSWFIMIV